jgi:hypothetical protein
MKNPNKTFVGGLVIGLLSGSLITLAIYGNILLATLK